MIVRKLEEIEGSFSQAVCPKGTFISNRFLTQNDNMGFTLTKTIIPKGDANFWCYRNHLEACFCISGKGILTDLHTSNQYEIAPDTMYALDKNNPHTFKALEDTVLICVFNPALRGNEIHNQNGSYERS